jgi:hypothetical protein
MLPVRLQVYDPNVQLRIQAANRLDRDTVVVHDDYLQPFIGLAADRLQQFP